MGRPAVFMFSGQGSQYYHMGAELFENQPVFRYWMQRLDGLTYQMTGQSTLGYLYDETRRKGDRFDRLLYTHVAVFMVEYALAQTFLSNGVEPGYVIGSSLGEFAAATLAGVLKLEDALESVVTQAGIVERACAAGGMLAVLDTPDLYTRDPYLRENSELAAVNFHAHFVLAGYHEPIRSIQQYLQRRSILMDLLPVSYGFHSAAIDPAGEGFRQFLSRQTTAPPRIHFLSCAEGTEMDRLLPDHFWAAVRRPIRFGQAIDRLALDEDTAYLDLGPTGTLAAFLRQMRPEASQGKVFAAMTPFSTNTASLQAALAAVARA